ncbi:Ig-like domain-containing protein [Cohnella soli]|uniref:Ig-like domain-containing protein n=1 Tax=Cohnella soli TaxID=425005 RepID=A0ABW0HM68_9BACL
MTSGEAAGFSSKSRFTRRVIAIMLVFFIVIWGTSSAVGNVHASSGLEITTEPQDIILDEGNFWSQTLSVVVTGGVGTVHYQWYRSSGGNTIALTQSSSLVVPTWEPFESDYYVTVTDDVTSVTSRTAHLKVSAQPGAPEPSITAQPVGNETLNVGDPMVLTVGANVTGSGTLSYQWYHNPADSNNGGFILDGQTGPSLTVLTGADLDSYYYVIVTNTDNTVAGQKTASIKSNTAHVKVSSLPSAPTPSIDTQPTPYTEVSEGAPSPVILSVEAHITGGGSGTLSYQWYRNTTDSYSGGSAVFNQTGPTLTLPTGAALDSYYYVVVTNTVAGQQPASISSNTAHVLVNALPSAPAPSIDTQPTPNTDVNEGATIPNLSVAATGTGTLSYQWYRNTMDSYSGASALPNQTGPTYTVPTGAAHDSYYYVVVTNTVTGQKASSITSNTAHVKVNDVTSPSVTISSGIYWPTAQHTFGITILFSEPVTGFTGADITITNGTVSNFQAVNSQMYTADITAAANGPVTINVPAAVAADSYGNLNTAATPHVVTYDTIGPTVNISSSVANPTNQSSFVVTLEFNEPPQNFSADSIAVTNGTASQLQSADGLTYTAVITPTADGPVTVDMAAGEINDLAGNVNTAAATSVSTVYDGTPPTATITSSAGNPTNQSTFGVTITFSEAVTGFTIGDLSVTNGTASILSTSDSRTYTANITPAEEGEVKVSLPSGKVADAAGNGNLAATPYETVYDSTSPTVIITSSATNPTNQSPFGVTITFSEAVNGFDIGDLSVTNGTASNLITSDNRTYTADIAPTENGTVAVSLPSGKAADAAGNGNTAATPFSTVYDATAPVLTEVSIASDNATPSLAKVGDTVTITFSASKMLQHSLAVTIAGHAVTTAEANGVYTAVYTLTNGDTEGAIPLRIEFSDLAGNAGIAVVDTTDDSSVVFDKTPPEPVIVSPDNNAYLTNRRPDIKGTVEPGSTVTITINGAESHVPADSNGKWQFTPENDLSDGKYTITVGAIDPAGNSSEVQAELVLYIYTQSNESANSVDVLINGKPFKIGKLTTSWKNGQSVTTLTVDERELARMLTGAGKGAVLTIPMNTDSGVLIGQLNAQMIKDLEQMNAVVEFKTKNATYTLSAKQFNIDALSKQLGSQINLRDIAIQVEIAAPSEDMSQLLTRAAEAGSFTVVASPVSFTIRALHAGTSTEISTFSAYVKRTIVLPDGVDPSKVTTAVVIEPDGTVRHVPTRIEVNNGKYTAHISSLTNSTYAVVWHPLEFIDVANHWAKEAVNDMGSRLVIDGIGNGQFNPDTEITRAEFAAIIVRGLGLNPGSYQNEFSDVSSADWYSGAVHTAYALHLIDGFEDGTFRPNDKLTREQAMAILAKAMQITNGSAEATMTDEVTEETLRSFTDASEASAWARSGIASSINAGIISGRSKWLLAPKANMTRAEVAAILERLLKQAGLI